MALKEAFILGIKVNPLDYKEVIAKVTEFIASNQPHYLVTVNPEMVMTAQNDNEFKEILNQADLAVVDGIGVKIASLINGEVFARVTGTDLIDHLAAAGSTHGWRFFFLGGTSGSGLQSAAKLKEKYPDFKVAGCYEGDGSENGDQDTVKVVKEAGPIDILLVAYGHPKQEKWISRNLQKSGVKLAIGVGGAFNYLSGQSSRPPVFIRHIGFEWLYRLVREPWRAKRQSALPKFVLLVLQDRFFPRKRKAH